MFGFISGAYISLQSVVLTDMLGLEKLESALGLVLLFSGVATFIGPPIVGFLYDLSNSYTPGFLFAGGMIALSGAVLFATPMLQKYVEKKKLKGGDGNIATIVVN